MSNASGIQTNRVKERLLSLSLSLFLPLSQYYCKALNKQNNETLHGLIINDSW